MRLLGIDLVGLRGYCVGKRRVPFSKLEVSICLGVYVGVTPVSGTLLTNLVPGLDCRNNENGISRVVGADVGDGGKLALLSSTASTAATIAQCVSQPPSCVINRVGELCPGHTFPSIFWV